MSTPRDLRRERSRSRAFLQGLSQAALEEAGARFAAAQQAVDDAIEAVALQVPAALAAGLSVTQIAEATGLSRQKIYELRDRYRPDETDLRRRVLIRLAAEGAQTLESLTHSVGENEAAAIEATLHDLHAQGAIRVALTQYSGTAADSWFLISAGGEAELEALIEHPYEARRMVVYAAIGEAEVDVLVEVATQIFGEDDFAVLRPGTVSGQSSVELAFQVVAPDHDSAIARGRERLDELRRAAGLKPKRAIITAVAPGEPWHAGALD